MGLFQVLPNDVDTCTCSWYRMGWAGLAAGQQSIGFRICLFGTDRGVWLGFAFFWNSRFISVVEGPYVWKYKCARICVMGTSGGDGLALPSLRQVSWNGSSRDFTRCVLAFLVTNGGFFSCPLLVHINGFVFTGRGHVRDVKDVWGRNSRPFGSILPSKEEVALSFCFVLATFACAWARGGGDE